MPVNAGTTSVRLHRVVRDGLMLALIALCAATLVAGTYQLTGQSISQQSRRAQEQALLDTIPGSRHDNDILDDTIAVGPRDALLGLREQRLIHIARQNGAVSAVVIPVTARDGFSGDIELRVGVNRDGSIAAVRVLAHDETPGLGDRLEPERSDWLLGFNGRSLGNPALDDWSVRKDRGEFDQFTGATITPRAVVAAISRALQFAQQNRAQLFGDNGPAPTGSE
jgi:electron transport complex protein RnfG